MPWNGLFSLPMSVAITLAMVALQAGEKALTMLNVSYDPTRELYQALNTAFAQSCGRGTRSSSGSRICGCSRNIGMGSDGANLYDVCLTRGRGAPTSLPLADPA
jgi:hypothetical protein